MLPELHSICLHNHTFHSDGAYGPAELIRRAAEAGLRAIAITDHADSSNLERMIEPIVKIAADLRPYWPIAVVPGCELTHVPPAQIDSLCRRARELGSGLVVVHGETSVEPVQQGTNMAAIAARADVLAHPGPMTPEELAAAIEYGVAVELSLRAKHFPDIRQLLAQAQRSGLMEQIPFVINADAHSGDQLKSTELIARLEEEALRPVLAGEEIARLYERVGAAMKGVVERACSLPIP